MSSKEVTQDITLSPNQIEVVDGVLNDILNGVQETSIGGKAGTGKSTVTKYVIQRLDNLKKKYIVLAPTGKAANVLRSKGLNADTIHSAIYVFAGEYTDEEEKKSVLSWHDKIRINDNPDVIIVDEASMVNSKMAKDLRSFNKQIVWVGDFAQLPPVGGDPRIMHNPKHLLNEIFRQKGDSGIVDFAHDISNGNELNPNGYKDVNFYRGSIKDVVDGIETDQFICGFNKTRLKINKCVRQQLGHKGILNEGEKLLCLHNNRRYGIFNGEILTVLKIHEIDLSYIHATVSNGAIERELYLRKGALGAYNPDKSDVLKNELVCDYGYAITCHKSQGSEWESVTVFNEEFKGWDHRRWFYTAATRASKKLNIIQ